MLGAPLLGWSIQAFRGATALFGLRVSSLATCALAARSFARPESALMTKQRSKPRMCGMESVLFPGRVCSFSPLLRA
jgi:hypothetical protein